ncbi:Transcriptional regulator containing HTH domain [Methanonatronarchaeum thermophilum]|uniref:Transcriptional regulator containing HTH domain n=1 Tax=Methanonatronarchaeum thermophilum TaxID=1927129 RepID=A0A1Y3GH50_9EURY|nr:winged helix-turn-helix domain-containing protein [Methanonatronarchaeum thermophilum]OUJ18765.1 Transcriptional regulator containing HTH domain [Methanonatronarchaeum thermophilum]
MKKRSEWEIYLDILDSLSENGSMKKTSIMHDVHMSWKPFNNHFGFLNENGFITESDYGYNVTDKGKETLKNLRQIKKTLENNEY